MLNAKNLFTYKKMSAEKILVLGFATLIIVGALLLTLPYSSSTGKSIGFLNALFTATSATCVTGLTVLDTAKAFSLFGKSVILSLIQVGGLGFMMFGTFILILLGKRISLKNRMLIRDAFNTESLSGIVRLYRRGVYIALSIELAGVLLLCCRFIPLFGFYKGLRLSVFQSISAFCNAGFDLFGNFNSLISFSHDPFVLIVTAMLIILGGLGFIVIDDLLTKKFVFKKLSLHSKIVISMTAFLIVSGTALLMVTEYSNFFLWEEKDGFFHKLLNMFFQSVTLRTAGFTSVPVSNISDSGKLLSVIWMFTGASPASTGGGIKTSTMFLLILQTWAVIHAQEDLSVFSKQISKKQSSKAIATIIISFFAIIASVWFLGIFESSSGLSLLDILYETVSAMATVGLSSANTFNFSEPSIVVLIIIMFLGRVGPLTIALALGSRQQSTTSKIQYPEERILIG